MAKIKCPGCGADIDTESGHAEYSAPAAAVPHAEAIEVVGEKEPGVPDDAGRVRKPSRFWRNNG